MIVESSRGGRGWMRDIKPKPPEKDPLVKAVEEAQTQEAYLDLFRNAAVIVRT